MTKPRILIAGAVLALAAAACGDDTPSGTGATPPASSPTASPLVNKGTADATAVTGKFELELDNEGSENYFKPTFIKVKPGQVLSLELKNEGTNPHTFTITSLSINNQLDPGKQGSVSVTLPTAGGADVQFFCNIHAGQGMRGAFFFGSAPQTTGSSPGSGSGTGSGDTDSY